MKADLNSAKNRPGDRLEALWRLLACSRGPRLNFESKQVVRWTPPGRPDGVIFSTFFQCKINLIFCLILGRSGGGEVTRRAASNLPPVPKKQSTNTDLNL